MTSSTNFKKPLEIQAVETIEPKFLSVLSAAQEIEWIVDTHCKGVIKSLSHYVSSLFTHIPEPDHAAFHQNLDEHIHQTDRLLDRAHNLLEPSKLMFLSPSRIAYFQRRQINLICRIYSLYSRLIQEKYILEANLIEQKFQTSHLATLTKADLEEVDQTVSLIFQSLKENFKFLLQRMDSFLTLCSMGMMIIDFMLHLQFTLIKLSKQQKMIKVALQTKNL